MVHKEDVNGGKDTRLTELDEKIASAQPKPQKASRGTNASQVGFEFSASVLGGGFLGWLIDRACQTTPWFMLIFLILGFIAGIVSMWRVLKDSSQK